jgi:hypothetical protein
MRIYKTANMYPLPAGTGGDMATGCIPPRPRHNKRAGKPFALAGGHATIDVDFLVRRGRQGAIDTEYMLRTTTYGKTVEWPPPISYTMITTRLDVRPCGLK